MKNTETEKQVIGRYGEKQAARYYRRHGAHICARNFRAGRHEIDLIAETSDTLIFIEVKTRTQTPESNPFFGIPASAVTQEKIHSLKQAAYAYLGAHRTNRKIRFDVAEVYLGRGLFSRMKVLEVHIIEDAFR